MEQALKSAVGADAVQAPSDVENTEIEQSASDTAPTLPPKVLLPEPSEEQAPSEPQVEPDSRPTFGRSLARAVAARAAGRWEIATPLFLQLYREQSEWLGANDPITLRTRRELAACLAQSGDSEGALIHYYGCLALHTERDAFALGLQRELAQLLLLVGEREQGEKRMTQAALLARELFGTGNPVSVELFDQVASSAYQGGDLDGAAETFERALEQGQAPQQGTQGSPAKGSDVSELAPRVAAIRATLVQIYQRLRRPDKALEHARKLLAETPLAHPAHAARSALVNSLSTGHDGE